MKPTLEVAEALERAADLVFIDGWLQRDLGTAGGPRCALGHLKTAGEQIAPSVYWRAADEAERELEGLDLICWNNAAGRTASEVRDLFLTAAKNIRNNLKAES